MNQADFTPHPWTYGMSGDNPPHYYFHVGPARRLEWHLERMGPGCIQPTEADVACMAAAPAMFEALATIVAVWERQSGRVFESMGSDNPRALAIEEAVMAGKEALRAAGGRVLTPEEVEGWERTFAVLDEQGLDKRKPVR